MAIWSFILLAFFLPVAHANVLISEVAFQGTSGTCDGEDWVELWNSGEEAVDLSGLVLHDDKGISDPEVFRFPTGVTLEAGGYLLLCEGATNTAGNATLPAILFGIGNDDTVTLARQDGNIIENLSVAGPLPEPSNPDFDGVTYSYDVATDSYNYTATPTPGEANIITALPTVEEVSAAKKEAMKAQNEEGTAFFNFDPQGMAVEDGMDPVLELRITMNEADWNSIQTNPQHQDYQEFQSATVQSLDGVELLTLTTPGRIRTRGLEGVYLATCLGAPLPYRLDFDSTNETQTLFGVSRLYLRHPLQDPSHMREWAYHRMLAKFGLPHVRTRMVDFYVNDQYQGFYTLMEQPEQEYVFARSFPDYDPTNFALFQTSPLTQDCGLYSQEQLEEATLRVNEAGIPPYAFERGDHVSAFPTEADLPACQESYQEYSKEVMDDVVLAYVRNEELCPKTFTSEGLIDQELGTDNWDNEIENWIIATMSGNRCEPGCEESPLDREVDVENFLKTFAFYAVTLNVDSPLTSVNNHYLAQTESDLELWKLQAFDFDQPGSPSCNQAICEARFIHWSIARPTCTSLEENPLVGPLLTNETLFDQYIGYVSEFLDTVYNNPEMIQAIEAQASAIEESVKASYGNGESFDIELSPDAAEWNVGGFPLLPFMKARSASVQEQLAALEQNTFPRGPHTTIDNDPWETCADWRLDQPDTTKCKEGCNYEGCFMEGWTVESFCDEANGRCYHGDVDEQCASVADGDSYAGMEPNTFCRYAKGFPVKASDCEAVEGVVTDSTSASSSSSASARDVLAGSYILVLIQILAIITS